jgi:hypothetical protein
MPHSDPEAFRAQKRKDAALYHKRHREKCLQWMKDRHQRKWSALTARERKEWNLVKKFGITADEWDAIFESQGRRCALPDCRSDTPRCKYGWHTDHDHKTGKVRGILCAKCNQALGFYEKAQKRRHVFEAYICGASATMLWC